MKELGINDEVLKAKQLLQNIPSRNKPSSNVYNDLSKLINKTLTERAFGVIDLVENYIDDSVPSEVFKNQDILNQTETAEKQINLFEKGTEEPKEDAAEQDEEFEVPIPNSLHMSFFFEQAGIGLCREEMYKISLAMKTLVFEYPVNTVRFWGKLFGIEKCYYIAEVEFREGEGENEAPEDDEEEKNEKDEEIELKEDDEGPSEVNLPISTWKPPPQILKEDHHTGTNKYNYFVCNEPGDKWERLPHVAPIEIAIARQINKFFTGNLDAKVSTYPPFPGDESNLLRAQIARISACTQISPVGYFDFDNEEEEEEEEELRESYIINTEFEGLSVRELIDPSMSSWAHHTQYILPQGRCTWFNPYQQAEDDFEEEEDEEEEQPVNPLIMPESGPNLLASASDDKGMGNVSAWSTYISSQVLPEYAIAVARSNIWPGAFAFSREKIFENIYIGWGKKYSTQPYAPPQPPPALDEFPISSDIVEMTDPTVEEEAVLKEKVDARKAAEEMDEMDEEEEDDD